MESESSEYSSEFCSAPSSNGVPGHSQCQEHCKDHRPCGLRHKTGRCSYIGFGRTHAMHIATFAPTCCQLTTNIASPEASRNVSTSKLRHKVGRLGLWARSTALQAQGTRCHTWIVEGPSCCCLLVGHKIGLPNQWHNPKTKILPKS